MRKITINLDTMEITNTGPLSIRDAANAGINVTLNAVIKQAEKHGWEYQPTPNNRHETEEA